MKRIFWFVVGTLAVLIPATWTLCASGEGTRESQRKILILKNGRTLEGEIEQVGDRYRIRREVGELWLPAENVNCLCTNWQAAWEFMRSQSNLLDPDERLRLAKWGQQNDQYEFAIEEANAALKMRPKHTPTKQLLRFLEHVAKSAQRPPADVVEKKQVTAPPALDLSADSLSLFTTKVQPILMNTCARCHTGGKGGNFQLLRTSGYGANRQLMTQHNMAEVVKYVNLLRPELSPVLIKAVSVHGTGTRPPINSRKTKPYQHLNHWVHLTVASNPHLKQHALLAARQTSPPQPGLFASGATNRQTKPTPPYVAASAHKNLSPAQVTTPSQMLPTSGVSEPGGHATPIPPAAKTTAGLSPGQSKKSLTPGALPPLKPTPLPLESPKLQSAPQPGPKPSPTQPQSVSTNKKPATPQPHATRIVPSQTSLAQPAVQPAPSNVPITGLVDEFDPEIFNRLMYPKKK